jgi:glycolate oxidase FAD binding subunit
MLIADDVAVDGVNTKTVITPQTLEEAAAILKEANATGQKVVIKGAGTKLNLGNPVQNLDIVLNTTAMNQIYEYSPADMVIGVQAGANLAMVQAELERNDQFLPVDSPLAELATIGGAIATNSSGPNRLQSGAARDWLIGVKYVLADGTIAKGGGRVVKNVAGYDMMKVFIGSLGTLGLIGETFFKLQPLPKAFATLVIELDNEKTGCDLSLKIIDKGLFPSALSVLNANGAKALGLGEKPLLLAEVRNTVNAVERQVSEISALSKTVNLRKVERIAERPAQKILWRTVSDFGYRQNQLLLNEEVLTIKAGVLPSHSAPTLDFAKQLANKHGFDFAVAAHAGHGVLYFTAKIADETKAVDFINTFSRKIESLRGSVTVERAPVSLKRRIGDVWGQALNEGEIKLMQGFKLKLDPNKTLSPGRFVAGI